MKKDKKIKIIIFIVLVIVILTILGLFVFNKVRKNKETKKFNEEATAEKLKDYEVGNFLLSDTKVVSSCKDDNDCLMANSYFKKISYKGNNDAINNILKEINDKNDEYYKKISSKENDRQCDKYIKEVYYNSEVELFEDDNYIGIAVFNQLNNLCDKGRKYDSKYTYIYKKDEQIILDNKQIISEFSLDEKDVLKKVNDVLKENDEDSISKLEEIKYNIYLSLDKHLKLAIVKDDKKYVVNLKDISKGKENDFSIDSPYDLGLDKEE